MCGDPGLDHYGRVLDYQAPQRAFARRLGFDDGFDIVLRGPDRFLDWSRGALCLSDLHRNQRSSLHDYPENSWRGMIVSWLRRLSPTITPTSIHKGTRRRFTR